MPTSNAALDAVTTVCASTPHGIHIYDPGCPDQIDPAGEHQPIRVLPGSDTPMRAGFEEVGWGEIDGIPVALLRPGAPTSLPPRVDGVGHVASTVSALAAFTEGRDDIFVNHRSVRDLDGRVIGARALGMFVAARPVKPGRLIVTRGLPGSGKTTWAKVEAARLGAVLVDRDGLREVLWHGPGPWPHGNEFWENACTVAQHTMVEGLLRAGRIVIVHDTSLRADVMDGLRALAARCGVHFDVEDFTHVNVDTCIRRDAGRPKAKRVGKLAIRSMWRKYLATAAELAAQDRLEEQS